jgi:hypothetical protein
MTTPSVKNRTLAGIVARVRRELEDEIKRIRDNPATQ